MLCGVIPKECHTEAENVLRFYHIHALMCETIHLLLSTLCALYMRRCKLNISPPNHIIAVSTGAQILYGLEASIILC